MRGRSLASARNTRDAPAATTRPRPAPASARTKTSVSNCAATEALEAPSENLTEISCWRAAPRDSSSAAMLVHAIRSSSETDPNRIQRDCLTPPTVASLSGAPQRRSDPPDRQETGRRQGPLQFLGKLAGKLRFVLRIIAGNCLKRAVQAVPVLQSRGCHKLLRALGIGLSQLHKLIAVWKWQ